MKKIMTGLDVLLKDNALQSQFKGNVALLCHNASVDGNLQHATLGSKRFLGTDSSKFLAPNMDFPPMPRTI